MRRLTIVKLWCADCLVSTLINVSCVGRRRVVVHCHAFPCAQYGVGMPEASPLAAQVDGVCENPEVLLVVAVSRLSGHEQANGGCTGSGIPSLRARSIAALGRHSGLWCRGGVRLGVGGWGTLCRTLQCCICWSAESVHSAVVAAAASGVPHVPHTLWVVFATIVGAGQVCLRGV